MGTNTNTNTNTTSPDNTTNALAYEGPDWLQVAMRELGVKEVRGGECARILEYFTATSCPAREDEVPWCSAFVNWVLRTAQMRGTGSARARSWLEWGVHLSAPRLGCVVVFSRGSSPTQGHVGFYLGEGPAGQIRVLGGNQRDEVCIATYPASKVLGYRWPSTSDFVLPTHSYTVC